MASSPTYHHTTSPTQKTLLMAKYIIQIPEPCSEDWNQMTPLEKGRFCAVCEKEIYDFSTYTKQELVQHIQREGKVCGRIPTAYLDVDLISRSGKNGLSFNGIIAAAVNLLVLTTATTVQGQEKNKKCEILEVVKSYDTKEYSKKEDDKMQSTRVLKGQVVDEDGIGLPGAGVFISGTTHSVGADFEGNFVLSIPDEYKKIELVIQFIGMKEKRIKVKEWNQPIKIVLQEDDNVLGEVVVTQKKKKWLFF